MGKDSCYRGMTENNSLNYMKEFFALCCVVWAREKLASKWANITSKLASARLVRWARRIQCFYAGSSGLSMAAGLRWPSTLVVRLRWIRWCGEAAGGGGGWLEFGYNYKIWIFYWIFSAHFWIWSRVRDCDYAPIFYYGWAKWLFYWRFLAIFLVL